MKLFLRFFFIMLNFNIFVQTAYRDRQTVPRTLSSATLREGAGPVQVAFVHYFILNKFLCNAKEISCIFY
jgi:hypothetical protein